MTEEQFKQISENLERLNENIYIGFSNMQKILFLVMAILGAIGVAVILFTN